jgi:hypothetical protein
MLLQVSMVCKFWGFALIFNKSWFVNCKKSVEPCWKFTNHKNKCHYLDTLICTNSTSHLSLQWWEGPQWGRNFCWGGDSDKEGPMRRAPPNEEGPTRRNPQQEAKIPNEKWLARREVHSTVFPRSDLNHIQFSINTTSYDVYTQLLYVFVACSTLAMMLSGVFTMVETKKRVMLTWCWGGIPFGIDPNEYKNFHSNSNAAKTWHAGAQSTRKFWVLPGARQW